MRHHGGHYRCCLIDAGEVITSLSDRVLGRVPVADVVNRQTTVIVKAGELISEEHLGSIEEANLVSIKIRSALTCETKNGVCGVYGRDLARGTPVNMGEAVGVIAAQSIGEPGTVDCVLSTLGVQRRLVIILYQSNAEGQVQIENANIVTDSSGRSVVMGRKLLKL